MTQAVDEGRLEQFMGQMAGYMTGGGNMAAFGALLMVTSVRPEPIPMIAWFALISALGVFAAGLAGAHAAGDHRVDDFQM